MSPLLWTVLLSLIMAVDAFMLIHHYRNRRTGVSRQQIPLVFAFLIGPLYYFLQKQRIDIAFPIFLSQWNYKLTD